MVEFASGPADVSCELTGAAGDIAKAEQLRSDADGIETLPLVSSAVLDSAGTLGVRCRVNGVTAYASEIRLNALKVTNLRATAMGNRPIGYETRERPRPPTTL